MKVINKKSKTQLTVLSIPFLDFLVQLLFELTGIAQNLSITEILVFGIPILLGPR